MGSILEDWRTMIWQCCFESVIWSTVYEGSITTDLTTVSIRHRNHLHLRFRCNQDVFPVLLSEDISQQKDHLGMLHNDGISCVPRHWGSGGGDQSMFSGPEVLVLQHKGQMPTITRLSLCVICNQACFRHHHYTFTHTRSLAYKSSAGEENWCPRNVPAWSPVRITRQSFSWISKLINTGFVWPALCAPRSLRTPVRISAVSNGYFCRRGLR